LLCYILLCCSQHTPVRFKVLTAASMMFRIVFWESFYMAVHPRRQFWTTYTCLMWLFYVYFRYLQKNTTSSSCQMLIPLTIISGFILKSAIWNLIFHTSSILSTVRSRTASSTMVLLRVYLMYTQYLLPIMLQLLSW
jgi:hypothetical protein